MCDAIGSSKGPLAKCQADNPVSCSNAPQRVTLCGTFVLNNGLYDCVPPKCKVSYFDEKGNLKCFDHGAKNGPITNPQSIGTFGMVGHIFVKEGFQGIYAGLAPTFVMGVPVQFFIMLPMTTW
jgi:hypothetical protein